MRTSGPGQSALLLLDVIDILSRHMTPYMTVGAIAAAFHGVVRASQDADVVVSLQGAGLAALNEPMTSAGFRTDLKLGGPDDPVSAVMTLSDSHENRVDLLAGIRGMEGGAISRSVSARFLGESIRIVGAEDFIAMKIFAGGPKDLDDARGVLGVSGEKLDLPLLKKLARRYGADEARKLATLLKAARLGS